MKKIKLVLLFLKFLLIEKGQVAHLVLDFSTFGIWKGLRPVFQLNALTVLVKYSFLTLSSIELIAYMPLTESYSVRQGELIRQVVLMLFFSLTSCWNIYLTH